MYNNIKLIFLSIKKLEIPNSSWKPTKNRNWIISPVGSNPEYKYWVPFAAIIPALLIFIVLFFEVELTQFVLKQNFLCS